MSLSLERSLRLGAAWMLVAGLVAPVRALPLQGQHAADQALVRNARGQVNTIVGLVSENSLTQVVIISGTSTRKLAASSVERIDFGAVPQAFTDARAQAGRGDFAAAAAKFALAAADPSARPVVRARACLAAAESWLKGSRGETAALAAARSACEQFLAEYPGNRDVPLARLLLARLQRLAGEPAQAAETYAALFREAIAATSGYPPLVCFQAGLGAGEAYLAGGDPLAGEATGKARALYLGLENAVGNALASLPDGDPLRGEYAAVQSEARLGEGFCLLAAGNLSQARTFFLGQLEGSEGTPARRFGARLGLGEALLADGNPRAAQIEFAQVAAIDHTSADREARALVGLAASALKLQARNDARLWLETVRTRHGDTPAARAARELEKSL